MIRMSNSKKIILDNLDIKTYIRLLKTFKQFKFTIFPTDTSKIETTMESGELKALVNTETNCLEENEQKRQQVNASVYEIDKGNRSVHVLHLQCFSLSILGHFFLSKICNSSDESVVQTSRSLREKKSQRTTVRQLLN